MRQVDVASSAAVDGPEHFRRIEKADLRLRDRRQPDAVMELQQHELDEEESVLAAVAALEAALLDLAVGVRVVSVQDVADVVVGERVRKSGRLSRKPESPLGHVRPESAPERSLRQETELLVAPQLVFVDASLQERSREKSGDAGEAL